jgi:hypothetical protein
MNKTRVAAALLFILLLAFGLGGACSYYKSLPPKKSELNELAEIKKDLKDLSKQVSDARLAQARDHNKAMASLETLREHTIKASQACAMAEVLSRNLAIEKRAK